MIESEHAGSEEVRQRRLDVAQLLHVRDEPPALDSKDEVLWDRAAQASKLERRCSE